ncbi:hypothetical protein ABNF65_24050, partial [Paenibacillus larvae]
AMNMAPFIFWNLAFYTIIRTQLFFDLTHALEMPVKHYSLGMKYKLFLNCMLARSPEFIILDEPFTSLDETSQKQSISMLTSTFPKNVYCLPAINAICILNWATVFFSLTMGI